MDIDRIMGRLMRNPNLSSLKEDIVMEYIADFMRISGAKGVLAQSYYDANTSGGRVKLPKGAIYIDDVIDTATGYRLIAKGRGTLCGGDYLRKGTVLYVDPSVRNVSIIYRHLPLDDEGRPMVPADSMCMRAVEAYIKVQHYTILFESQSIPPAVLQQAQQDYSWAIGAYLADQKMPDEAEMREIGKTIRFSGIG